MAIYTGTAPSSMYADYLIDLSVRSQDERANTTTLNYRIFLRSKGGGYPFSGQQHKLDFTADSRTIVNTTTSYRVPAGGEFTLASGTFTVAHNSNGTKIFNFSSAFASYHGTCSVSGTMTLPTISRGSTLSITNTSGGVINSADIGTAIRLKVNKGSSSYTHQVGYEIMGDGSTLTSTITSYSDSTGYVDFVLPTSWISSYLKNNVSKNVMFFLKTYNNGSLIHTDTRYLTIYVPDDVVPTVNNIEVLEDNANVATVFGDGFYQNLSRFNVRTTASGVSGSTITSYKIEMDGKVYTSTAVSVYLPSVSKSGTVEVKVTVTDSRGRIGSGTVDITVLPYSLPSISMFSVSRQSNPNSADARLIAKHSQIGEPDKNSASITVKLKKTTESTWTDVYSATSNVTDFNELILLGSALDTMSGYNVRATISDKFNSHSADATLPTSDITITYEVENNNIGIGGIPDITGRDGLHVHGHLKVGGSLLIDGTIDRPYEKNYNNMNAIFTPGFYTIYNAINLQAGMDPHGTLICTKAKFSSSITEQKNCIHIYLSGNNTIWMRNSIGLNNAWTTWVKI